MEGSTCPVCDLRVAAPGPCPNYWCGRADRGFDVVWAIGEHGGELRRAIAALKYRGDRRWIDPLGRLLAGFLVGHGACFDDVDLILGTPPSSGRGRSLDHVQEILGAAARCLGELWAIDLPRPGVLPVVVKRVRTEPMMSMPSAFARRLWAAGELRAALAVTDPARVRRRRLLVVDDVFTDGSTMREMAGVLLGAGATSVSGLVLARACLHSSRQ
jgi:predicted amidophosphoribosyltransferase